MPHALLCKAPRLAELALLWGFTMEAGAGMIRARLDNAPAEDIRDELVQMELMLCRQS
jgi:hypothetical protein